MTLQYEGNMILCSVRNYLPNDTLSHPPKFLLRNISVFAHITKFYSTFIYQGELHMEVKYCAVLFIQILTVAYNVWNHLLNGFCYFSGK